MFTYLIFFLQWKQLQLYFGSSGQIVGQQQANLNVGFYFEESFHSHSQYKTKQFGNTMPYFKT